MFLATAQKKWELSQKKKDSVSAVSGVAGDKGGDEVEVKEKEPLKLQVLTPVGEGAESGVGTPTEKKEDVVEEGGGNAEDQQKEEGEKMGDDAQAVCIDSKCWTREGIWADTFG